MEPLSLISWVSFIRNTPLFLVQDLVDTCQAYLLKNLPHEGKQITNIYHAHISVPQGQEKEPGTSQRPASQKAAPKCSICGYPRKGHKNVSSCPENQKKQT